MLFLYLPALLLACADPWRIEHTSTLDNSLLSPESPIAWYQWGAWLSLVKGDALFSFTLSSSVVAQDSGTEPALRWRLRQLEDPYPVLLEGEADEMTLEWTDEECLERWECSPAGLLELELVSGDGAEVEVELHTTVQSSRRHKPEQIWLMQTVYGPEYP